MDTILRYLVNPMGGLKNIPLDSRSICILNQADTKVLVDAAKDIAPSLLDVYDSVVVSSLKPDPGFDFQSNNVNLVDRFGFQAVHAAYEPVAGIVLAAGESRRFGQPKQLLPWKGKPLVWHSAHTAIQAGLKPVLVVTGAFHHEIEQALAGLEVEVLLNPSWNEGQGTSVSAGVAALPGSVGASVFFLADQPHIPLALINQLVSLHAVSHAPVIMPWVENRQANPVLFDRDLFPELKKLTGDRGGRVVIAQVDPVKLPWQDPSILFDVDTPDDYNELLGMVD
jgi:molybdenum cofactor cytidylyltransferase